MWLEVCGVDRGQVNGRVAGFCAATGYHLPMGSVACSLVDRGLIISRFHSAHLAQCDV